MTKHGDSLAEIRSALYEGRYDAAFQLCRALRDEPGCPPEVLYAGAAALFGLGHVFQAEEWIEEHGERTRYNADNLYLQAYLELHKNRFERALLLWTRIVQIDPSETFADNLIEKMKRGESRLQQELRDRSVFAEFVPLQKLEPGAGAARSGASGSGRRAGALAAEDAPSSGWLARLLRRWRSGEASPGAGLDPFWKLMIAAALRALVAVLAGVFFQEIASLFRPDPYRQALETLPEAPGQGSVTPRGQYEGDEPRFFYEDRDAALREYQQARELIGAGRPNEARRLLGRLELSNASFEIKERALLLRESIPRVPRADFRDPVPFAQLLDDPYLYRGAEILWTGRVRDPARSPGALRFVLELPSSVATSVQSDDGDEGEGDSSAASSTTNRGGPARAIIEYVYNAGPVRRNPLEELRAGDRVEVYGEFAELSGGQIMIRAESIEIR